MAINIFRLKINGWVESRVTFLYERGVFFQPAVHTEESGCRVCRRRVLEIEQKLKEKRILFTRTRRLLGVEGFFFIFELEFEHFLEEESFLKQIIESSLDIRVKKIEKLLQIKNFKHLLSA